MSSNKYKEEAEAPENHERWLITYADLITLLMIFFIIMYTMARVDSEKFAAVRASLNLAMGGGGINTGNDGNGLISPAQMEQANIDDLELKLDELIKKYNLQDYINVMEEERGLDIEIRNELSNSLVFESGSSELGGNAKEIIAKIGELLKELPENNIRVEGHTDNLPINTTQFKSNWELSSARATTVVKFLINEIGLNPQRVSSVGYAEFKPVSTNDTSIGRAKNRRVNIIIIRNKYSIVESKQPVTAETNKSVSTNKPQEVIREAN